MGNSSEHARALACDLINEQFGDIAKSVCNCLVNRGTLLRSQADILRITGLPLQQLRSCLTLLIQHNCVQAFRVGNEDELHYTAILDNILHRMRKTKFLTVFTGFGKEAEEIASTLFQHGRLNWENLSKNVAEARGNVAEHEMPRKEIFQVLVRAQLIEPCPADELASTTTVMDERAAKKLRAAAQEAQFSMMGREEQAGLFDPSILEGESFQNLERLVIEEEASAGQKRKRDEFDNFKETLWRLSYKTIIQCLKKEVCINLVRRTTYFRAAAVVECMLEKEEDLWNIKSITEAVSARDESSRFSSSIEKIPGDVLHLKATGYVNSVGEESYKINTKRIIDRARQLEVEEIVSHRFGRKYRSILRLLFKCDLNHKEISQISLLPVKEVMDLLKSLADKGCVKLQPSSKALWRVNLDKMCVHLVDLMYRAMCSLRLHVEREQSSKSPENESRSAVFKNSMKKLDDSILLLHDFCT